MSTTESSGNLRAYISDVEHHAQDGGIGVGETFHPSTGNESSIVLIGETTIIKSPFSTTDFDAAVAENAYEAAVVKALAESAHPAPLAIPSVKKVNHTYPVYSAYTKIPGFIITPQDMLEAPTEQQRAYGTKIGTFVSWLADALPLSTLKGMQERHRHNAFDPIELLRTHTDWARSTAIPDGLTDLLFELSDELSDREIDHGLVPSISGHYDFSTANQTFDATSRDKLALYGAFDFGMTRPSTPEQELRFTADMPDVFDAAADAYTSATGIVISEDTVVFWATAQHALNMAGAVEQHNWQYANEKRQTIERLRPSIRWE